MADKLRVVQGATAQYYHVLPSELDRAIVTPEREAIFQYLSRLGSERFVDFITDVLVLVEKHRLIERTDGSGDEKQDILTLDPEGRRHLTQCKHTADFNENSSGDELDLLLGACMRKDCRGALYVTNADLTVQAKRYVTDREYGRGWAGPPDVLPRIDYWNGRRIWERVSKSNAILNKWFGGMAQAHALRRFFFDVIILSMPDGEACPLKATDIAGAIGRSRKVSEGPDGSSYDVVAGNDLLLNLSDWFCGSAELGIPFALPGKPSALSNLPLPAIRVQAAVSDQVGAFAVAEVRDRIGRLLGEALPDPGEGKWWHVTASAPQAFVFLQDIGKAALVPVEGAGAYVRVGDAATQDEDRWAVRPAEAFEELRSDDDDLSWKDRTTETTLRILVEQAPPLPDLLDLHFRERLIKDELFKWTVRAARAVDVTVLETVRRLAHPRWYVLESSTGDVFLAHPPDAPSQAIRRVEEVLARRGVAFPELSQSERDELVGNLDTRPEDYAGMITSAGMTLTRPVLLNRRIFWLSKNLQVPGLPDSERMLGLVAYKASYEARYGFDFLRGKTQGVLSSEEAGRMLFDLLSFRGTRMLDIVAIANGVSIHLRVREGTIGAASDISKALVPDFEVICSEIAERLRG